MIKTLRITSIIAAVLSAGLLVFPAIFGLRSDKEIEEFLNLPSVVEKFRKASGDDDISNEGEVPPLVKYAQAFGLYLNPPPKAPKPTRIRRDPDKPHIPEIVKPPPVSAKFKLIATSFSASSPELSLALIDAPGKGRLWVRESSEVSHLTIEHIKDGIVVVKGTKGTFEIPAQARPQRRSLLAGSEPVSMGPSDTIRSEPVTDLSPEEDGAAPTADALITGGTLEQMLTEEQAALAAKMFAEMAAMSTEGRVESAKTDSVHGAENPDVLEKPFSDVKTTRVTDKEVKKLDRLGKELKGIARDLREDPNRPKSRKTDKSSNKSWKSKKRTTPEARAALRKRLLSKRRAPLKKRTSSKEQTKEKGE